VSASSANYKVIMTTGASGQPASSANSKKRGGVIGATQGN